MTAVVDAAWPEGRLTLAVSKGRILDQALALLGEVGIEVADIATSRRLVFATSDPRIEVMIIRAQDVPTFVEYGAADLGIAGKDVLMERERSELYEPLDLGIARCRLVLAGPHDGAPSGPRPRVATKYVRTARRYFAARGMQVEVIHLYGSMEIAPRVGLADQIVDLVDSGATLRANGLVEIARIADISSRLVVNKAAMKMKHAPVREFIARLARACAARDAHPAGPRA